MTCRLRRVGSGLGRCSPLRGRPRLRGGAGLSGAGGSSLPSLAVFWTGFSRASISVASRAIAPMMRPPSARSISAAWILSGSAPRANSANARENVASRGYFGFCQTPRVLTNLEAWIRRRLRLYLWRQWRTGQDRFKDPRLISLIRRWLKAGILEDGAVHLCYLFPKSIGRHPCPGRATPSVGKVRPHS